MPFRHDVPCITFKFYRLQTTPQQKALGVSIDCYSFFDTAFNFLSVPGFAEIRLEMKQNVIDLMS